MVFHGKMSVPVRLFNRNINKAVCQRFFATEVREKWKSTVGLEVHAQMATKTKLFSGAPTDFTDPVNSCVSLFDCAIPGTMPVLNKKCVEAGVLTALALSCTLNEVSVFERKHYFYADLPAGFQITQQKKPLAVNGEVTFDVFTPGVHKEPYSKSSKLKQLQLEQDSGKSLHNEITGRSLIDLNRAGIPLMEFVFEPDLSDGEEAAALVKELIIILQQLGTSTCKMEEGVFRVDANVSVSKPGEPLGVRTELKNIGSVRAVAGAIKHEIDRQISILSSGGRVINETRSWDAQSRRTVAMREKEEKQDYRFMPETNLPPLQLHMKDDMENVNNLVDVPSLRKQLPQLPADIREELRNVYNLSPQMIKVIMGDLTLRRLFYSLMQDNKDMKPQSIAAFLSNEVLTFAYKHNIPLESFFSTDKRNFLLQIIEMLQSKAINTITAKKILLELLEDTNKMPKQIVEERNWFLMSDEVKIEKICFEAIEKYPKFAKRYKKGKKTEIIKLLRHVAVVTDETADMVLATKIMERLLSN